MSVGEDRAFGIAPSNPFVLAFAYLRDAAERSVLFWDVMRQRADEHRKRSLQTAPHVLDYAFEILRDGRNFERPVNYALLRIVPPAGEEISTTRRPFVVIDPRAGHGPGIGGFKADSEIGEALRAGHPCYFVGFTADPMPGQTIEDIVRAEAVFLEHVISLHPDADGKPCVIGNCQAGWAVMILAALRPELFGPIIIAGAPLSYWAGVRGRNPMRYSAGLLGGSWLTAFTSDMGDGKFDGSWLVQNFENQNPANTLWSKQYNVYSKIDTEASRYLDFERWWGRHVNLNAEEMQFIVDELFVGNRLAAGHIRTSEGNAVDLRNIRSPIVVFCSKGDNITPPQQALGWILDLYSDVDEIRSYGQTIVYTVHETVGHLGIFVSSGVAKKEYREFAGNIDLIDLLPPGLYEATFEHADDAADAALVCGDWVMHCRERTLDDIRAMGGNTSDDERRFATVARVSEINLSLYRTFVQPAIRASMTPQAAEWLRQVHPQRMQYALFSNLNPLVKPIAELAEQIRTHRSPVSADNPFLLAQEAVSGQIVSALDAWRDHQEKLSESIFLAVYGSPVLQAAVGIDRTAAVSDRPVESQLHRELLQLRVAELRSHISSGGLLEAAIRGLIFVGMAQEGIDERALHALRLIRPRTEGARLTLAQFKAMAREQFDLLLLDQEAALAAIPGLLPADAGQRSESLAVIRDIVSAGGEVTPEAGRRLARVQQLFGAVGTN